MNQVDYVEFKKERDLGAIITDTFTFLRLEFKPFFITILKVSLLPILLAISALLYYAFLISNSFASEDSVVAITNFNFSNGAELVLSVFLLFVAYILAYVSISISGYYYLKSYIDHQGIIDENYIKEKFKEKFWSFFGLGILIGISVGVGLLFCFLPGIYFYIVFSVAFPVLVFKEKGAFDAYGDSFRFINGHWWETFGCKLVIGILVSVLGYVFSIPALIYSLLSGFLTLKTTDSTAMFSMFTDPIYIFLEIISYLGRFLFYAVTLVSSVFIYFDINEQKNATGTFEKIDSLGN